ncbi:MAG TPA: nucleotide exchange factor GrpE [Bacteroidia bacterium]|nr:nucleotide exchange factor GrpE [Bacteroidia bacterium]HNP99113.1 nucleotide exchange factor GrpE [Bacteroidia bacterium]
MNKSVDPNSEEKTIPVDIHQDEKPAEEAALPDAEKEESDPVAKLEAELSETKDRLLRLFSEFDNYKKRVAREKVEQMKMAGSEIFLSIIPVIDDFERALKSIPEDPQTESIKAGIQLIYNKIKSTTEAKGLKAMESIGKIFDADLHDAITNVPAPSEDMKGKVIDEIEKGYYLNDKVIRHAKVIVGN